MIQGISHLTFIVEDLYITHTRDRNIIVWK